MEYTIHKLAEMAGVSTRTLRHYDNLGLLMPLSRSEAGYRLYGGTEVDRLQQILFYREMGMSLARIKEVLDAPDFTRERAMREHLGVLTAQQKRIGALIKNVKSTLEAMKGESDMSDEEKFEGFKRQKLDENEQKYGLEIREKYGEETIERANERFRNMSRAEFEETERLSAEINRLLKEAAKTGDPGGKSAQACCRAHEQWLGHYWDFYSREAHMGLAQMYVDDPRFTAHYDKLQPGLASFLRDAVLIYTKQK